ncbi:MAG TPA: hypothetical protein VMJ34_01685 [Bryobacteraceae bacterium]|nr:hypothetical protein [Bryobacteraceae bacterium]
MDQNILVVQTVFTGIAAIAILLQAGILFGMFRAVRAIQKAVGDTVPKVESLVENVNGVIPKVNALVESSKATVEESRQLIASAQAQVTKLDEVVTDAANRARVQMDRVEMVLDNTMDKAQQTVNVVSNGVLRPLREVQGIVAGIQAAFGYLLRSARPSVDKATSDEEMFI